MLFTYLALIISALLIGIDQLIKYWAVVVLKPVDTIAILPNVLHLTYHENTGAAFSILSGRTTFLAVLTGIVLLGVVYMLLTKKIQGTVLVVSTSLIIAGGVGNLIDRVFRGFVVDYIDFRLINFAVFNFADTCVVIGTLLMVIYLLFIEGKQVVKHKEQTDDGK